MKKSKSFFLMFGLAVVIYAVVQFLLYNGILNPFYENTLITILINIMLAVSLHLVIGITGQFSIGHAGFLAVGAYIAAIFTIKLQMPFIVALIAAGLAAAIAGLIVGIPTLRLRGDYLAIATLGFAEIIRIVFLNWDYVGGARGMTITRMTDWTIAFICTILTILVIANFTNSRHGRACISILR